MLNLIKKYKNYFVLFSTSFFHLFLGAYNIWLIANNLPFQVTMIGFLIAFIWSYNVKLISVSSLWERLVYSLGAGLGTTCGMIFAKEINRSFNFGN
jgi:hypothetical protein